MENNAVGMAGQIVAAALETAGLYRQGQILNDFSGFLTSFGAMMYTFYAIGALLSVAIFGNYRKALYLFVSPALFYFCLFTQTEVTKTVHQFGERRIAEEVTNDTERTIMREAGDPARLGASTKVATVFYLYDRMISSVVQQLVAYLVDTRNNVDLVRVAREDVLRRVLRQRGSDQHLLSLIGMTLLGPCAKQVALMKELGDTRLIGAISPSSAYQEAQIKRAQLENLKTTRLEIDQATRDYLSKLDTEITVPPTDISANYEPLTCDEIWIYTRKGCLDAAEKILRPTDEERAKYPNLDWDEIYRIVQQKLAPDADTGAVGPSGVNKAAEILAAFYLRNTIATTPHGRMTDQMGSRVPTEQYRFTRAHGNYMAAEAEGEKMRMAYFAASLPYIQGILLYVLTAAFPFFCLFLLIPSRVHSFFTWASLWLWVKSWDIGFAFVFFLRGVFWELMPHAADSRYAGRFNTVDWDQPMSVMNAAYVGDPTAHFSLYYNLVGMLTLAIPVVTAQLCMGASGMYSALRGAIDGNANKFAMDKTVVARRKFANPTEQMIYHLQGKARGEAAAGARKNLGKTSEGLDRRHEGAGAAARHVRAQAARAGYNQEFSKEGGRYMSELAMYTGRRMPNQFGYSNSQGIVQAATNDAREMYETGKGTETGVASSAFTSSGKSRNTDDSIGKASAGQAGDGQDGD